MLSPSIELADCFDRESGFPYPKWDVIRARIKESVEQPSRREAWTSVARHWLQELCELYGREHYALQETENFLIFSWLPHRQFNLLAQICEYCRERVIQGFPTLADTLAPGKEIIVAYYHAEDYYSYISAFYREGEYGGSGGMQVRDEYPHVVVHGKEYNQIEPSIAHELTHAFLSHRSLPLWIEEGLAQMIESEITSLRPPLIVSPGIKEDQLRYWREHGLNTFWSGTSFSAPGEAQKASYELAEILLRLLFLDFQPRWFGFDQRPRVRLISFLESARREDCGQAAAVTHLGYNLDVLASKFLGPGDWGPSETSQVERASPLGQNPHTQILCQRREPCQGTRRVIC